MDEIREYLENSYTGARAMDNYETQSRIARAIAAYEADPEMEIFTEEFKEIYYTESKKYLLTQDEQKLIETYRKLDKTDRELVLREVLRSEKYEKKLQEGN